MKKEVVCRNCGSNTDLELYEVNVDFDTNTGNAEFYCSDCDAGTRIKFEIVNIQEVK